MKNTDETEISVPAVWSPVLREMRGGGFTDDDVDYFRNAKGELSTHHLAALALKYAYDKMDSGDDGPLAALKAASRWKNMIFLTPAEVCTVADNYASYADGWDTVLDEHLREVYDGFPLEGVTDEYREKLKDAIRRDSEIWVDDDNLPGLWVFNNPDHKW